MKEKKMGAGSETAGECALRAVWFAALRMGIGADGGDADTLVTAGLFARNAQLPPWPARQNLKIRHN
jgi:hypothetical protein